MSKHKWDGAAEPNSNNFYTNDNRKFGRCSQQIDRNQPQYFTSTEVDRNSSWRQSVLEDSYGPPAETQANMEI